MATEGISKSFFERVQEISCSKPAIGTSVIVALAVAIIGSLALTGVLYPHTPLATLGNAIGQTGAIAMLSSGGTAAFLILILSMCCSKKNVVVVEHVSTEKSEYKPVNISKGRDTGATGVPGHRTETQFS